MRIELTAQGELVSHDWVFDDNTDEGHYVTRQWGDEPELVIGRQIALQQGVTLRSVLTLVQGSSFLQQLLKSHFAIELIEHFVKLERSQHTLEKKHKRADSEYNQEPALAYLELAYLLQLDKKRKRISDQYWHLSGISEPLAQPLSYWPEIQLGETLSYSVSLSPLHELLDLPLRIKEQACVTIVKAKQPLASQSAQLSFKVEPPSLCEFLDAVFTELGFHGTEEDKAEFSQELKGLTSTEPMLTHAFNPARLKSRSNGKRSEETYQELATMQGLSTVQAANRLGCSASEFRHRHVNTGKFYCLFASAGAGLESRSMRRYPAWQFDSDVDSEALQAFIWASADACEWETHRWLFTPNKKLGGRRAVDLLNKQVPKSEKLKLLKLFMKKYPKAHPEPAHSPLTKFLKENNQ